MEHRSMHASELGIDPERIAIMGDSGGGGVAAGAAILARDNGTPLVKQILIYPMLDDRNIEPDHHLVPFAGWTFDNNYTGWNALLGEDLAGEKVSPVAAPARNTNFEGLAPSYIEVGELDIFRDESVEYASKLWRAGISVELHVHPGAPHGFELSTPSAQVTQRSNADRVRVLQSI
jgi:acetyl esterase/lipase